MSLKLTDALLGNQYRVATLDGEVEIKVPPGVKHGEMLRLRDKGVPHEGGPGDFLVKISIETPKQLSRNAKKLIEELRNEGL